MPHIEEMETECPFIRHDAMKDEIIIDGIRFDREIFKLFASEPIPGRWFRFIRRDDGLVTIEQQEPVLG